MSRVLDRLAPWTTTGVGSLPFTSPREAVAYVTMAYGLPFCPQLPRLEGDMVAEALGAAHGRCGWTPERDRERPRAWSALLAELREHPPAHGLVKLQVTGPVTLAWALERATARPRGPGGHGLALELATWLAANVAGQVRELAARGLDAVLVVDEPALALGDPTGVEALWEPLRHVAPAWGLHVCCEVPWALVDRAEPDLLSFDLALTRIDPEARAVLGRLAARGGWIAWGAIASHRHEHAVHGVPRLRGALDHVPGTAGRSLLTPSCGTGRLTPGRERAVAVGLRDIAMSLRERTAAHP